MFAVALVTGTRPGEAAGLLWEDLDLDAGTLTVRHAVRHAVRVDNGRPVITDELKTDRSQRTLDLTPDVVAMLRRHRTTQAAERLASTSWADDRLVFATRKGTPLDLANVRRELARICEAAEVPIVRPNELRHSTASIMSDAGVPLERIADQLGHATTRMLEQTYRHRLAPSVSAGAEVMSAVLGFG